MTKTIIFLMVFVSVAIAANNDINSDWEQFKIIHQKSYSIAEDITRKQIFVANADRIASHNRLYDMGLTSYRLGVNKFSDMTSEESKTFFRRFKPSKNVLGTAEHVASGKALPSEVDWRKKNIVTPVKNQFVDKCSSCWAFATTGAVEGQHALATGDLVSLSEQQLVDCTNGVDPYDNYGCTGGNYHLNVNMQYIEDIGGVMGEKDYPYEAVTGDCRFNKSEVRATINGFVNIKVGSEEDLRDAVATVGPIAVAMETVPNFNNYKGGIYDGSDCIEGEWINHAVLVVGYGSENGQGYYIIKNCWDITWGEKGYARITSNALKQCNMLLQGDYPTVKKSVA